MSTIDSGTTLCFKTPQASRRGMKTAVVIIMALPVCGLQIVVCFRPNRRWRHHEAHLKNTGRDQTAIVFRTLGSNIQYATCRHPHLHTHVLLARECQPVAAKDATGNLLQRECNIPGCHSPGSGVVIRLSSDNGIPDSKTRLETRLVTRPVSVELSLNSPSGPSLVLIRQPLPHRDTRPLRPSRLQLASRA